MSTFFAGLDWASQTHALCVIDEHGAVSEHFDIAHDAAGLAELRRRLTAAGSPPIAIERPSGLIVDTATRVQLANQLRSLLDAFWPGAARLGPKRMAAFCAQHAYSGRRPAEELLTRLHQAAPAACGELEMDAHGELARSLARTLSCLVEQIRLLSSRIEHHVASLDDGRLVMSFPRAGRICAAQILAELGSVRERFDSDAQFAAEAGVAPVTYQSGKSKAVTFRWACNHRLRAALTCLADNSRHASTWAARVYAQAPARGCDHPHAIRILARAWARVLWRAWTDRKPYDPALHRGAQALVPAAGG